MASHLEHLKEWCPDILNRKILDLGSGRGSFLIDVKKQKGTATGIETSEDYIALTKTRAKEAGVDVDAQKGFGEHLPFKDGSFDFVNMTEVIEHVEMPETVLKEVYRVLRREGLVYMSVPNRFGMKDQHYNLYFINWMPRAMAMKVLSLFGAHKDYSTEKEIGFQSLARMHYYTLPKITKLCQSVGFRVEDIRREKILQKTGLRKNILLLAYNFAKLFYFDSFHLKLVK